jgi:hypothetical protein
MGIATIFLSVAEKGLLRRMREDLIAVETGRSQEQVTTSDVALFMRLVTFWKHIVTD